MVDEAVERGAADGVVVVRAGERFDVEVFGTPRFGTPRFGMVVVASERVVDEALVVVLVSAGAMNVVTAGDGAGRTTT